MLRLIILLTSVAAGFALEQIYIIKARRYGLERGMRMTHIKAVLAEMLFKLFLFFLKCAVTGAHFLCVTFSKINQCLFHNIHELQCPNVGGKTTDPAMKPERKAKHAENSKA